MFKWLTLIALLTCSISSFGSNSAYAGSKYAKWVHHGDTYIVRGNFAGKTQSFRVKIIRKGQRYIVRTPLGDYPLAPRGSRVTFKVHINKAWANITWDGPKAIIKYKNKTGSAKLQRSNR